MSLNNEACINWPTLIDLNPLDLKYYQFMISLDKCRRSCNSVDELSIKLCVPSKTKDMNVKEISMKEKKNEVKRMVKHIWYHSKCKFNSTACNSNQI